MPWARIWCPFRAESRAIQSLLAMFCSADSKAPFRGLGAVEKVRQTQQTIKFLCHSDTEWGICWTILLLLMGFFVSVRMTGALNRYDISTTLQHCFNAIATALKYWWFEERSNRIRKAFEAFKSRAEQELPTPRKIMSPHPGFRLKRYQSFLQ